MVCAQCHSLRDVIGPGFAAGADYFDYFQPVLEYAPRKESDPTYWVDGRPRRFSNDAMGLWQSECFLRGGATCTSCHRDPHLPDVDKNPQLGASSNALCTGCHTAIGAAMTSHTRHLAGSPPRSCVECHMPRTVLSIRRASAITPLSLPAPENTERFAIPNACNSVTRTRSRRGRWTRSQSGGRTDAARSWWRAPRPSPADAPAGRRRWRVCSRSRRTRPRDRWSTPTRLATFQTIRTRARWTPWSARRRRSIRRSARPRFRVSASRRAATLREPQGRPEPRRLGGEPLDLGRLALAVPAAEAQPLHFAEDERRFHKASLEFAARARPHEDDAAIQRDLGVVQMLAGDFDPAGDALQIAMGLEADRPTVRFLLGMVRFGQRRLDEALTLFKQVPASDPYYAAAQAQLKKLQR
jgi:predicted CXXCH cytochrome family protein